MTKHSAAYLERHESLLKHYIESHPAADAHLKNAMMYSLFPGGKRFRPLLVYLTGELTKAPLEALDRIAMAIELTHCFSLVHDDLPAMDNDDYRRGQLSCHKAFDEATAILAGNAMQMLSIECLLATPALVLAPTKTLEIATLLLRAFGIEGMLSGQSLDLQELHTPISEKRLREIHSLKTGRVIEACIDGAILAGDVSVEEKNALKNFAKQLGLLFQIQDDYLDRYASETLGKNRISDASNDKTTFATLYSREGLQELITESYQTLQSSLACFNDRAQALSFFIKKLIKIHKIEAVEK